MATDLLTGQPHNSLHRVAGAFSLALGGFLALGALGHLSAVWPVLEERAAALGGGGIMVLLPGLLLLAAGLINLGGCWFLWAGGRWSLRVALATNALLAGYLALLMARGVPDHPIGPFLALVCSYVVLLLAIRLGLVWPAGEAARTSDSGP